MNFLLQSEFQNESYITLQRSQDYHYWKNNGKNTFTIRQTPFYGVYDPKEWCPVGSVEFVHKYYKEYFKLKLKPINVPNKLYLYSNRNIIDIYLPTPKEDIGNHTKVFVKSKDIVKWKGNSVYEYLDLSSPSIFPEGNYQLSNIIDIVSEYRCFVHRGELLGIHYYQGDFWEYPSKKAVKDMIESYKDGPSTYTLDVAIHYTDTEKLTSVLEVHDFYACGLYGFQNLEKLPYMYWASHLDKIKML